LATASEGSYIEGVSVHSKSWQRPPIPHIHRVFLCQRGRKLCTLAVPDIGTNVQ